MDSGMISKIEKSRRYAEEPERIAFQEFRATFNGEHGAHQVGYDHGEWSCECSFFQQRGVCCHSMAMERLLEPMLKRVATETEPELAG